MEKKIHELKKILSIPQEIVITVHRGPDGDAMGSALGLYNVLIQLDHKVTVITPNEYASFLQWIPNNDKVVIFTENEDEAKKITNQATVIFFLDFNSISRLDKYADLISKSSAKKIMIDHHQDPDQNIADIIFSKTSSSSTAELLFEVIVKLGYEKEINKETAECLYTGIMTDTGSFKHSSTTSKTHEVISKLIIKGANNSEIHSLVFDNFSEDRTRLLGYCINKKLQIFPEYRSAIISLSNKELKRFNFKKGDTEGFINYALSIKDIVFAIFIAEKESKVKMSFRSKGNFNVNEIANKYFNGGGHLNASGGISDQNIDQTIKKLKKIFQKYKYCLLSSR